MSLKAIEMQIALPRTHDAGKLQEELQQRGQIAGHFANHQLQKEEKQRRKSVVKQEKKSDVKLHHDESNSNQLKTRDVQKNDQNSPHDESPITHPYKGTVIDFTG